MPISGRSPTIAQQPKLPTDAWAYPALLWWSAWSENSTFLHIPKTGGTVVEQLDLQSGRERLLMLPPGYLEGPLGALAHHMTPLQLEQFGVPAQASPYNSETGQERVYCIMREPLDRFVSEMLYQEIVCHRFAKSQFGMHKWRDARESCMGACKFGGMHARLNASEVTSDLVRCFARFAQEQTYQQQRQEKSATQQRRRRAVTDAQLHLQPQSVYIRDAIGQPTCHDVFRFEDLAAARITKGAARDDGRNFVSPKALAAKAASLLRADESALTAVQSLYREDFELWARVSAREAPTRRHAPLSMGAATLLAKAPLLAQAPPRCGAGSSSQYHGTSADTEAAASPREGCTCPSLCCERGALRRNFRLCMQCLLDSRRCGGAGQRRATRMPPAAARVCQSYSTLQWNWLAGKMQSYQVECNVCDACCEGHATSAGTAQRPVNQSSSPTFTGTLRHRQAHAWLRVKEPGCAACETSRCRAGRTEHSPLQLRTAHAPKRQAQGEAGEAL